MIDPEKKELPDYGFSIPVARLRDLVYRKLNSCRLKDQAHLELLDGCGLITASIEAELPEVLRERLAQVRSRYSGDEFTSE